MSEKIQALNEKDQVRKKISIWLGSNNHLAVIHTVKELIGNSSDEINKGIGNEIKITLGTDKKTITVEDNCNGLPVEGISKDTKKENYLLLTSVLFAGTKYQNGIDNQDYTVGTNGVFLTVLSRSSLFADYEIARPDGNVYTFGYKKGDLSKSISIIGKNSKTYTKITYQLDDEIFEDNFFTIEELCRIAEEQASLIDGTIMVIDEETKECFKYKLEKGISDLLTKYTSNKHHTNDLIQFSKEAVKFVEKINANDNIKMNMAMQYTQDSDENIQIEFLNGSNLTNHGTIQDGLITGLKNVAHSYLKANNAYKKDEKPIIKDDVVIGLNYLIEFKSFFPIYANQTKLASHVTYYKEVVTKMIEEYFEVYAIENKSEMDKIAAHVLLNKRLREKTDVAKLNLKKKLQSEIGINSRVAKFVSCKEKDPNLIELYIVEGDSALGSCKKGRDGNFQALMPIRGKILNCLKADYNKIFNSDIIIDLLRVLGCGIEINNKHNKDLDSFDLSKLRFSKIIICTDGDVDGQQIRTLVLTMIYRLVPTLIYEGKVFIVETPLFEMTFDKNKTTEKFVRDTDKAVIGEKDITLFAYSDKEKNDILKRFNNKPCFIQRSKGLGENTPEMMWTTTMNPKTRILKKINYDDAESMQKTFDLFLGDNLNGRKQYIEEYGDKYLDLSNLM